MVDGWWTRSSAGNSEASAAVVAQCKPAARFWNEGSIDFTLPFTDTEAEMQSECVVGEW